MTRPPGPGQPWWARPDGAPAPPARPAHPPDAPTNPIRQPAPARPAPRPRHQAPNPPRHAPSPPRPAPGPSAAPRPPASAPPRPAPVVDPYRYTLRRGQASHSAPRARKRPAPLVIGAVAVAAAVVLAVVVWQLAFRESTVIDVQQAENGVQQILSDPINGYGSNTVSAIECNNGENPAAEKGDNFTCAVEIGGAVRHVYVEFQDDNGTFAVDGPR